MKNNQMKTCILTAILLLSFSHIIKSTELLKLSSLVNLSSFTGYNNAATNGNNKYN